MGKMAINWRMQNDISSTHKITIFEFSRYHYNFSIVNWQEFKISRAATFLYALISGSLSHCVTASDLRSAESISSTINLKY